MAMKQATETNHGCTTTSIEGRVEIAALPTEQNKRYLVEKADYGVRFPRLTLRQSPSGQLMPVEMKQLVMSGLIRLDEYRHDYRFDYKAEVSFDMTTDPPRPFLSSSGGNKDPDRRHTLNPFPKGLTRGLLRRPDVIIVKDPGVRWPGQAGTDHDGVMHENNLERVVEVKFPGDDFHFSQRRDYEAIAGGARRLSLLNIFDCRDDDTKAREMSYHTAHQPAQERNSERSPSLVANDDGSLVSVPAYGPTTAARAAVVQWWVGVERTVGAIYDEASREISELSDELKAFFSDTLQWISEAGSWMRIEAEQAWTWISDVSGEAIRWTDQQLQAIWLDVQAYTDITLEMLKVVDWAQLLADAGTRVLTAVVIVSVAEVLFTVCAPASIVAGLLVLLRLAASFWRVLVPTLGGAALVPAPAG